MIAEAAHHTEWLAKVGGWDAHAQGHLVPPWASLIVIISLIGISVAASLLFPDTKKAEAEENENVSSTDK